jgi:heme-degrading monooxygenase HmoA
MWVRVATFEGVDPEKANAILKERMASGEMTPAAGMNSVLILDDKDAKKRKFFAFFESKDAITAAEAGFEQQGETIPEQIRGKRTSVHYYEVVIHDGEIEDAKAARVSVLEGAADAIDASLEKTRGETLPKVRAIDGNVGAIGLADRDNGRVSMITLWDSADAMRASEREADQLRERTADLGGQKITNVARYEVATAQTMAGARA